MSEKRFTIKSTATELELYDNGVKIGEFPHYEWVARPVDYVVKTLNEQQATISALKDIFKDIITYSEWDSKKPYCSLRIAVDKKTYYKIREILNE